MFCVYCGNKIEETFRVCPNCGALLDGNGLNPHIQSNMGYTSTNPYIQPNMGYTPTNPFPGPSTRRKTGVEVAALIMVILAAIFVVSVLFAYEEVIAAMQEEIETYDALAFALGTVFIHGTLSISAFFMGLSARKADKNGMNLTIIAMSIGVIVLSIVQVILIVNYIG